MTSYSAFWTRSCESPRPSAPPSLFTTEPRKVRRSGRSSSCTTRPGRRSYANNAKLHEIASSSSLRRLRLRHRGRSPRGARAPGRRGLANNVGLLRRRPQLQRRSASTLRELESAGSATSASTNTTSRVPLVTNGPVHHHDHLDDHNRRRRHVQVRRQLRNQPPLTRANNHVASSNWAAANTAPVVLTLIQWCRARS